MSLSIGALAKRFGPGLIILYDRWGGGWAGGTLICAEPVETVEAFDEPFERLDKAVASRPDCMWAGYISYDAGRAIESIPDLAVDDLGLPLVHFSAYPAWLTFGRDGLQPHGDEGLAQDLVEAVRPVLDSGSEKSTQDHGPALTIRRSLEKSAYEGAVVEALDRIGAGDFYQVNLAQRFSAPTSDPYELADRVVESCPSSFGAFIDAGHFQVISASPELFLKLHDGQVESRPIKGTRPRSRDAQIDKRLAEELRVSEKDKAENLMIVDLIRNDLGRVCMPGTIEVGELWRVESLATVHHMVSTITGFVRSGIGVRELLEATFPGGSITGAPKVAAMRFIEGVEPVRRSVYTGAVGWIQPSSAEVQLELNIAIRTVICKDEWAHLYVGGGIVADSLPSLEYQETLDKASGLAAAMGIDAHILPG